MAKTPHLASRYIRRNAAAADLGEDPGDVYIGVPYFLDPGSKDNPDGRITLLYREGDGARADSEEPWNQLRQIPGRVRIEFDTSVQSWVAAGPRSRPTARAKRFQPSR
jgi:hypothetical protein